MPFGEFWGKTGQNRSRKNLRCGWYDDRNTFFKTTISYLILRTTSFSIWAENSFCTQLVVALPVALVLFLKIYQSTVLLRYTIWLCQSFPKVCTLYYDVFRYTDVTRSNVVPNLEYLCCVGASGRNGRRGAAQQMQLDDFFQKKGRFSFVSVSSMIL